MIVLPIFDAINEGYFQGYNHIIFPIINFHCQSFNYFYYIPKGMTFEFLSRGSKSSIICPPTFCPWSTKKLVDDLQYIGL